MCFSSRLHVYSKLKKNVLSKYAFLRNIGVALRIIISFIIMLTIFNKEAVDNFFLNL